MLTSLSIRNVVLIEALDLEMEPGLTALTGETGAGKSIILDALGMATGARSDRGLVRAGADKAQCTASFFITPDHPVWDCLDEAGLDTDATELVLRRVVNADGRSRAFINDAPVGVKLLAQVGASLLEVHGQHDGRGLLDPNEHVHMLDLVGGHTSKLDECRAAYADMMVAEKAYQTLAERVQKSDDDREFLTFAIEELDRLDPKPGEDDSLAERRRFLQGAEGALTELSAAETALGEDGAFEARLTLALSGIERVWGKMGDASSTANNVLQTAAEALEKALLETQEARAAVSEAASAFDITPGELDEVEKRLFALRAAARKYDVPVANLAARRQDFLAELTAIDNVDADLAEAKARSDRARQMFDIKALALTEARQRAARTLDQAVAQELPPLKMERARFVTQIDPGVESALGRDKVRFQVATNPGTAMGPLDKIASGGELARFALAIKVALAGKTNAVMVFDEVDQGVGGAVADAVGRRLSRLSEAAQVFVVTHSPQVAASADHQFLIEKSSTGVTTTTQVRRVLDTQREEEIARMLAGETVTQEARAAARQLMQAS